MDQTRPSAGSPPLPALEPGPARRPVSGRSVAVGLVGVLFICGVTPFNNYVMNNTAMVGSHLPTGLLMFFTLFILLINAPLRRLAPRQALSSGELAVALGMVLVSCTLPSVGLMRVLPGHLVGLFHHATPGTAYLALLERLDLPDWLFPRMSPDLAERSNDPVVRDFFARVPIDADEPDFLMRLRAVPWSAWAAPAISWGLMVGAMLGAVICMSVIFRRQWAENERLPFPLATVYLSLIETPRPGRMLNTLFGSRKFWIAFGIVFVVHGLNGLHAYNSRVWPAVPLGFDINPILADPPWAYIDAWAKMQTFFFTIIGIVFFIRTKLAFSIWFFYVLVQVARMFMGARQMELTVNMQRDQMFGAVIPFAVAVLWVGRHHLQMVIRQMFGIVRPGEDTGRYLPNSAAGWGLLVCLGAMVIWLVMAGASWIGAVVLVAMLMMIYMVLARIVAETGLLYVLLNIPLGRPWIYLAQDLPALSGRTTLGSYFHSSMFFAVFSHDLRESSPPYVMHALRVADEAAYPGARNWRGTLGVIGALVLALAVGFVVAGASSLYSHYSYAATLDRSQTSPLADWPSHTGSLYITLDDTVAYDAMGDQSQSRHSRLGHFSFGAGLTGVLSFLRLRFAGWPLHPIGFILVFNWGIRRVWFSIFLGWLAKVLIVRLGGSRLLTEARPFFIGLILGEAGAAGFWLCVSVVRLWLGMEYEGIQLLPPA